VQGPATSLTDAELRDELERTLPAWQAHLEELASAQLADPPRDAPPMEGDAARHVEVQREMWARQVTPDDPGA
jgi:hypothetical protein